MTNADRILAAGMIARRTATSAEESYNNCGDHEAVAPITSPAAPALLPGPRRRSSIAPA